MNIDIKAQVQAALQTEWPTFAAAHPRLAAVMDESLIIESITSALADEPEYQESIANADRVEAEANMLAETIARVVKRWLRELL